MNSAFTGANRWNRGWLPSPVPCFSLSLFFAVDYLEFLDYLVFLEKVVPLHLQNKNQINNNGYY